MSKKNIFVVILTWNRRDLVVECIRSVQKSITRHNISIVVVDNNSYDDTALYLKKNFKDVSLIVNKKNLGWSGGNNVGIKFSLRRKADFIVLLNNDSTVSPTCIDRLVESALQDRKVGIVGPKIYKSNKRRVISNGGNYLNNRMYGISIGAGKIDKGQFSSSKICDFISGITCAKAEVYKKIGLVDEKYFLYFEDTDFCMRAKKSGYLSKFEPKAVMYHMESATIGFESPTHTYYNLRNHLLFTERYGSKNLLLREIFRETKLSIRKIVKKENNAKYRLIALIDYLTRRFGKKVYW